MKEGNKWNMQRWMNDILKTARAAAFVVAACALQASGAHAQADGAKANPLPPDPPAVAPNYEAQARELPSVERVGVDAGEPLTLTLDEAVRLALENNNDIEATRIDVTVSEHELTAARGAYDLRFTSETVLRAQRDARRLVPRGRERRRAQDDRRVGTLRLRGPFAARGRLLQV